MCVSLTVPSIRIVDNHIDAASVPAIGGLTINLANLGCLAARPRVGRLTLIGLPKFASAVYCFLYSPFRSFTQVIHAGRGQLRRKPLGPMSPHLLTGTSGDAQVGVLLLLSKMSPTRLDTGEIAGRLLRSPLPLASDDYDFDEDVDDDFDDEFEEDDFDDEDLDDVDDFDDDEDGLDDFDDFDDDFDDDF